MDPIELCFCIGLGAGGPSCQRVVGTEDRGTGQGLEAWRVLRASLSPSAPGPAHTSLADWLLGASRTRPPAPAVNRDERGQTARGEGAPLALRKLAQSCWPLCLPGDLDNLHPPRSPCLHTSRQGGPHRAEPLPPRPPAGPPLRGGPLGRLFSQQTRGPHGRPRWLRATQMGGRSCLQWLTAPGPGHL